MPLAPGTRLGPYEVLSPLGAGGMGQVYRARDTRLGRDVAVKVLTDHLSGDPKALARFQSEARAVAAISHPNILALHDVGESGGVRNAVTELLEGETLGPLVTRGHVPVRRALEIAAQVASALAATHEKGIVHRDLKPENVFLTKEGHAKLLDFGLARHTPASLPGEDTRSPTEPALTEAGAVVGTAAYMSPEQARGLPVDFRSDQFSLGVVLYEMLAGTRPFRGASAAETMAATIREEPEPLERKSPFVPPPVRWVVRRCLAKEPAERYHSTHDLAQLLLDCREHLAETTSSAGIAVAGAGASPGRTLRVAWLFIAAVAVGAAFFLAGSYLGWLKPGPPERRFQRLTFRRGTVAEARFAPDGHTVVYSAAWDGRPSEVFSVRLDGPESLAIGYPNADLMAISPSSELALCVERGPKGSVLLPPGTLALAPFGGGTPRKLGHRVSYADWSADGREMVLVREEGPSRQLELPPGRVLYRTAGNISSPRISTDGSFVAFLDHSYWMGDPGSVAVVDRAGKKRTLTTRYTSLQGLALSPDGSEVWFTAADWGLILKLRAVTLSGRERPLLGETGPLRILDVGRDGRVLVDRLDVRNRAFFRGEAGSPERDLSCLDYSETVALSRDGKLAIVLESGGERSGPLPQLHPRDERRAADEARPRLRVRVLPGREPRRGSPAEPAGHRPPARRRGTGPDHPRPGDHPELGGSPRRRPDGLARRQRTLSGGEDLADRPLGDEAQGRDPRREPEPGDAGRQVLRPVDGRPDVAGPGHRRGAAGGEGPPRG
ncbi:MAG: serine/threonine-protein kinase [Acidobacteria bacterium]|nr:MAG: serine/threonine-protein kinase [Acidobacteriota bacterium]MCE7957045.1 hypothetical protein [Acidobacteria bacterium ACB2]